MQQTQQSTTFNDRPAYWLIAAGDRYAIRHSREEALRYAHDAASVGKILCYITAVSDVGQPERLDARAILQAWDELNLTPPP